MSYTGYIYNVPLITNQHIESFCSDINVSPVLVVLLCQFLLGMRLFLFCSAPILSNPVLCLFSVSLVPFLPLLLWIYFTFQLLIFLVINLHLYEISPAHNFPDSILLAVHRWTARAWSRWFSNLHRTSSGSRPRIFFFREIRKFK